VSSHKVLVFYGESLLVPVLSPNWRTTLCQLSTTAYSTYMQLPTLHIWRTSLPATTWGHAMLWWQRTHLTWEAENSGADVCLNSLSFAVYQNLLIIKELSTPSSTLVEEMILWLKRCVVVINVYIW